MCSSQPRCMVGAFTAGWGAHGALAEGLLGRRTCPGGSARGRLGAAGAAPTEPEPLLRLLFAAEDVAEEGPGGRLMACGDGCTSCLQSSAGKLAAAAAGSMPFASHIGGTGQGRAALSRTKQQLGQNACQQSRLSGSGRRVQPLAMAGSAPNPAWSQGPSRSCCCSILAWAGLLSAAVG